ncbi:hypothetical protein [Naasia aerilata]|uniref:hypothetical protein n=1 Tax=Naasia aerilata TaxID=1162966 RepID=UPI002573F18C|nr:hypothetical protein [Naasia aerilata]
MITADDLRGMRVFAALPEEALDYLVRSVEDIRLMPGSTSPTRGTSARCSSSWRGARRSRRW